MANIQAERSVIGALIIDENAINKIYRKLFPRMFSDPVIGDIYNACLRLSDNREHLTPNNIVYVCGDVEYDINILCETLRHCIQSATTSFNLESDAKIVIDEFKVREVKRIISTTITANTVDDVVAKMIDALENVCTENKDEGMVPLKKIVEEYAPQHFVERKVTGVNTGLKNIDNALGDLEGGDTIIIAARPSVGKSALVTQISSHMADCGKKVGYFNLEMSDKQIYQRMVSAEGKIDLERVIRATNFLGNEEEKFSKANGKLSERAIEMGTGSYTVGAIRRKSRHAGYDVLIIDYLQLLKADRTYNNRSAEVGDISKSLKALAQELGIPIIVLSQLNRASEMGRDKEPTMAELRESGDIEQDASIIIMLWNLTKDRIKKGCKIEKNRQGRDLREVVEFDGAKMTFIETDESFKEAKAGQDADDDDDNPFA